MRLTDEAESVALKYGSSVSKGIMEMEARLCTPSVVANLLPSECSKPATSIPTAREKFMNTPVPSSDVPVMFNDAFWKKLREEVTKSLEPMVGKGY